MPVQEPHIRVNIHHAKTHLSELIAAAENGEEVIIVRAGRPAVKLASVGESTAEPARKPRQTMIGAGIGKLWMADDFDSPATNLEMQRLFEG
jgi:prevent-host-death family protein